jgi:isoamylase
VTADNEISWLDWEHADKKFLDFCAELVAFRHRHPVFRRRRFFEGRPIFGSGVSDIGWFRPDGIEMSTEDWQTGFAKSLAVFFNGDALPDLDPKGHLPRDDSFLLLFNAHWEDLTFVLPGAPWGQNWLPAFGTAVVPRPPETQSAGAKVVVAAREIEIFKRV